VLLDHRKRKPRTDKPDPGQGTEKAREAADNKAVKFSIEQDKSLEKRLETAESKAEENYDRLLRVTAEFENYKKRMAREMSEFRKFANESLMKDVLLTVDNLQRALETPTGNHEKALDGMREGVEMTLKALLDTLEKHGVEPIKALKQPFDPNLHHAVMQEESDEDPENTVSQELQKGYIINDRLLRPAMVVVSKKAAPKEDNKEKKSAEGGRKIKVNIK
jgi:molecular chaperone GrpE